MSISNQDSCFSICAILAVNACYNSSVSLYSKDLKNLLLCVCVSPCSFGVIQSVTTCYPSISTAQHCIMGCVILGVFMSLMTPSSALSTMLALFNNTEVLTMGVGRTKKNKVSVCKEKDQES